jgi:hypothetical protein
VFTLNKQITELERLRNNELERQMAVSTKTDLAKTRERVFSQFGSQVDTLTEKRNTASEHLKALQQKVAENSRHSSTVANVAQVFNVSVNTALLAVAFLVTSVFDPVAVYLFTLYGKSVTIKAKDQEDLALEQYAKYTASCDEKFNAFVTQTETALKQQEEKIESALKLAKEAHVESFTHRDEINARQFIFRMREFEQMEMQFFVKPGEELKWFEYWKEYRLKWHKALGLGDHKYRFHDHDKLAHYANAATDIEFELPFGFKEIEGIHSRTDFDLSSHEKFSGKNIKYFDPEINQSYTPFVVETSIGLDRTFLSIMASLYNEETLENGETRVVLALPPVLAPVKACVMPLVKKDGLPEKAREIINELKFDFKCAYDEKDSIGKRYRRQDAVGTPFCITVDHQTAEDNSVTIRHRDTMAQERVAIADLHKIIGDAVNMKNLFKKIVE